jgi:hypothetical protein
MYIHLDFIMHILGTRSTHQPVRDRIPSGIDSGGATASENTGREIREKSERGRERGEERRGKDEMIVNKEKRSKFRYYIMEATKDDNVGMWRRRKGSRISQSFASIHEGEGEQAGRQTTRERVQKKEK